jgi:hypothetical protein
VPVLLALTAWGDRWSAPDGPPLVATHRCGSAAAPAIVCAGCGEALTAESLRYSPGPGGRVAKGTMLVGEYLAGGVRR